MKLLITTLIFSMLCVASTFARQGQSRNARTMLEAKVLGLLTYAEELGIWQGKINDLYEKMAKHSRENNGAIDARDMEELRNYVREFHSFHYPRVNSLFERDPTYLYEGNIIELTDGDSFTSEIVRYTPLLEARERSRRDAIRFTGKKVRKILINPASRSGELFLLEMKLQVSAKILLLESYMLGLSPFIDTKVLRGILLRDIKDSSVDTVENLWFESMEELLKRETLMNRINLFEEASKVPRKISKMEKIIDEFLENSVVVDELQKRKQDEFSFFKNLAKNMSFMAKRRWDTYRNIGVGVVFQGSKVFGNTLGLFQSRKGYLYDWNDSKIEEVSLGLRPLDLLFEKTPFRLTDRFIPGHFGHVAIWSGTEKELRELGVWEELSEKNKNFVREGRRVIEALRPGVQINTFKHFLDIDDLAIFRMRSCREDEAPKRGSDKEITCLNNKVRKEYLLKAFGQIGKDYDFAFDVNTENKIVCSELVYRTFLDIDFETSPILGLQNISPDQVAKKGDDKWDPFHPVFFYHQGELVPQSGEELRSFIKELMNI